MRTFIKTEEHGYIDTATITGVDTSGTGGGTVWITTPDNPRADVAHATQKAETDDLGIEKITAEELHTNKMEAEALAESLMHAICKASPIASATNSGATIHHNPETTKWIITDLEAADSPQYR